MSMDENGPVTSRGATWGTLEMNCLIEVWSSEKARCEAEAVPNTSANRNDKLFYTGGQVPCRDGVSRKGMGEGPWQVQPDETTIS